MNIRRANADEADTLTLVARRAKASWGYPAEWLEEWEAQLRFTPEYIRDHVTYVAEIQGHVAGVISLESSRAEPEIAHFWVAPEYHGKGIGRALLTWAVQYAGDSGWHSLRIESDPSARAFYERLGAEYVGEVDAPVCGTARQLPVLRLRITSPQGPESHGAP